MRAAYIVGFGGPEAIRYGELPDPEPGPGEVLVRTEAVAAAAWINHQYSVRPLEVSVGDVLPFSSAAHAHTLTERGDLPRLPDHTVGRLVLRPDH